jgi:hypothetical protein
MQKPRYWERSSRAAPEAPDRFVSCRLPAMSQFSGNTDPKCKRWHCFIVPRSRCISATVRHANGCLKTMHRGDSASWFGKPLNLDSLQMY